MIKPMTVLTLVVSLLSVVACVRLLTQEPEPSVSRFDPRDHFAEMDERAALAAEWDGVCEEPEMGSFTVEAIERHMTATARRSERISAAADLRDTRALACQIDEYESMLSVGEQYRSHLIDAYCGIFLIANSVGMDASAQLVDARSRITEERRDECDETFALNERTYEAWRRSRR